MEKLKEKLQIAQGQGGQLLKDGIDKYWTISKAQKNATIYMPFFSFSCLKEQKTEEQKSAEK